MTRKSQSILALACLGLLGAATNASACSFAQWNGGTTGTVGTTLIAGQPDDANPVPRYVGKCGSLATATGNFTTDNTPSAEAAYRVQFYVYTGLASGTATVFQALNNSAATAIQVDYNATAGQFTFTAGASVSTAAASIAQNRWYAVQLNWANGGSMAINVQGANSLTTTALSVAAGSSNIETARLGWVSGAATTDATHKGIVVDAFESRRATEIARVCRGDANGDGVYGVQDRIAMTNEILRLSGDLTKALPTGAPDADESGFVSVADRILVTNFIIAVPAKVCPTTSHAANET